MLLVVTSMATDWQFLLAEWALSQFTAEFENNGWTDPSDWHEINNDDLLEMGMKKGILPQVPFHLDAICLSISLLLRSSGTLF